MPAKRLVPLVIAVALVAAAWLCRRRQAVPSRLIALGARGEQKHALQLLRQRPQHGHGGAGDRPRSAGNLVGISFRPADGQLYGVGIGGNTESVFRDRSQHAARRRPVGSATPVGGTFAGAPTYGVDFNPVADRLRVVDGLESESAPTSTTSASTRTTRAIAGVDTETRLQPAAWRRRQQPAAGDDRLRPQRPRGDRVDRVRDHRRRQRQPGPSRRRRRPAQAPNGGALTQIGPLGVDTSSNAGLDIDPATGEAYAILQVAGVVRPLRGSTWRLGAATLVGKVAGGTIAFSSLAIVPPAAANPELPPTSSSPPSSGHHRAARPPPALQSLTIKPYAFLAAASGGPIAAAQSRGRHQGQLHALGAPRR